MKYTLHFRPRVFKDLSKLSHVDENRVMEAIEAMVNDLSGDVTRLRNYSPSFRLRVGDYRVLFDIEKSVLVIHSVLHRRDAYKN